VTGGQRNVSLSVKWATERAKRKSRECTTLSVCSRNRCRVCGDASTAAVNGFVLDGFAAVVLAGGRFGQKRRHADLCCNVLNVAVTC
jgi:hypothetical protein